MKKNDNTVNEIAEVIKAYCISVAYVPSYTYKEEIEAVTRVKRRPNRKRLSK